MWPSAAARRATRAWQATLDPAQRLRADHLADDPHATGGAVDASELERRVWLMREPGRARASSTRSSSPPHQLEPQTLTLGSNGAIKQAARAGLGIAFISRAAVALELEATGCSPRCRCVTARRRGAGMRCARPSARAAPPSSAS